MRTQPRVFVASSGEAERLAEAIQQNLKVAEVTLWTQDAFRIGHTVIDELNRNLERSDFGVFVFAPNDIVVIRGQEQQAVRDNVVLELGMFIGRLGKERSFIVRPKGVDMRLPTDLLGIVTAKYDRERAEREPTAALGSACTQISDAIKLEHRKRMREVSLAITESLETICWSMASPETPERASLRAFIFKQENNELVCRGFWDPFLSTEQVGKTKFPIDEKTAEKVVVVKCFLDNETKRTCETEGSSVAPLPSSLKGVKGRIKPSLKYVLAAPIRNENDTIWGVVDFDASNNIGKKLLQNEKTSNAVIQRLARDLSKILAR
ncbi:MAG: hypothetical protein QOH63_3232 [Acidobacteriota bacterium]|jgi:hypothetical protein|nr:hypothetical protein [Acidobacteriota bacterium]MDT5062773.1 hypothetical protein [Acidobacteriota bacterium]